MLIFTADGYLQNVTIGGELFHVDKINPSNTGSTRYTSGTLTITADHMPEDNRFMVTDSMIDLYSVGTDNAYTLKKHVTPAFIIELS